MFVLLYLRCHEEQRALGDDPRAEDDDEGQDVGDDFEDPDRQLQTGLALHRTTVRLVGQVPEHVPSFRLVDCSLAGKKEKINISH